MPPAPRTVSFTPAPEYGMRPGTFTYYVIDLGNGRVRLSPYADGKYGPAMPRASVKHFVNDLEGRVALPRSGRPEIDAVISGRAILLGKGDDGLAFRVGNKVIKVSTTVPFQPENSGHLSPKEARERLRYQTAIHNRIADAKIPCVQRAEFVRHGDKGFQIKPFVEEPAGGFTREQLDRLQDCLIAMHRAGVALQDHPQAGVDAHGHPIMFDVGKAQPIKANDALQGSYSAVNMDMDNLRRLYEKQGHRFVRRDIDEAGLRWQSVLDRVAFWSAKPTRHKLARRTIREVAEARRLDAEARLTGEALASKLERINGAEARELEKFGQDEAETARPKRSGGSIDAPVLFALAGVGVGAAVPLDRWIKARPLGVAPSVFAVVALGVTAAVASRYRQPGVRNGAVALAGGVALRATASAIAKRRAA